MDNTYLFILYLTFSFSYSLLPSLSWRSLFLSKCTRTFLLPPLLHISYCSATKRTELKKKKKKNKQNIILAIHVHLSFQLKLNALSLRKLSMPLFCFISTNPHKFTQYAQVFIQIYKPMQICIHSYI
jgi:hypothetical protein